MTSNPNTPSDELQYKVCGPHENVYQAAKRHFGDNALVDVLQRHDHKWYIGWIASRWGGPFFGVYEKTHD